MSQIHAWHICIGGYRQHEGRMHGALRLWQLLGPLRRPDTVVSYRAWNANWREIAETIFLASDGGEPIIRVYAYSWGAGYGFIRLAKELRDRGIGIKCAVLSDPVYRSPLISLRWLALFHWNRITVPSTVGEVWWFRQTLSRLQAHGLRPEAGASTIIHEPVTLVRHHYYMDDAPAWHAKCCEVAGMFSGVSAVTGADP
jgi:hypothetical protein